MRQVLVLLLLAIGANAQTKATAKIILDSVQAKYPGNEHVKECAANNSDSVCFDPKLEHYVFHQYINKATCKEMEQAVCVELVHLYEYTIFAPVDKPFVTSRGAK